jgi:hypothetical protein
MMSQLISDADAKVLSRKLAEFGDQAPAITAELDNSAYGRPAALARGRIEAFAKSAEALDSLRTYWREYAKERLASLAGPVNIPRGRYPRVCEYRSDIIKKMRERVALALIRGDEGVASPQIEPTLKQFVEKILDAKQLRELAVESEKTRINASSALGLQESEEFAKLVRAGRKDFLGDSIATRFVSQLAPAGFIVDSRMENGLVCRKQLGRVDLDFALVFEYGGGLLAGALYPLFSLTLRGMTLTPGKIHGESVATFSPETIVPEFRASCVFTPDSFAQFCLAIDSIAFLTKIVCSRLEEVLID